MTRIYVGPGSLLDLGSVGETELLTAFDGEIIIPEIVAIEVSTEPAKTNMEALLDEGKAIIEQIDTDYAAHAQRIMGVDEPVVESRLLEVVLERKYEASEPDVDEDSSPLIGLVTEDRRLRTVAEGLGATVTGSFGAVIRASTDDKYLSPTQAKRIVRRIDTNGLHLTGELRAQAVGDL